MVRLISSIICTGVKCPLFFNNSLPPPPNYSNKQLTQFKNKKFIYLINKPGKDTLFDHSWSEQEVGGKVSMRNIARYKSDAKNLQMEITLYVFTLNKVRKHSVSLFLEQAVKVPAWTGSLPLPHVDPSRHRTRLDPLPSRTGCRTGGQVSQTQDERPSLSNTYLKREDSYVG